jgi:hypothetical protein
VVKKQICKGEDKMKVNKMYFVNTCVCIPVVTSMLVKQYAAFLVIIFVGLLAVVAWRSFENN